jgi:hypothetical protein
MMTHLRCRLAKWFAMPHDEAKCPACGRIVVVRYTNRTVSRLAGSWSIPFRPGELIAYCREQHGTDHGSETAG